MKKALIVLVISLAIFNTGCSNNNVPNDNAPGPAEKMATVNKITAEEANTKLTEESGIILVDVRTEDEYFETHIPNAILLPVETIGENAKAVIPEKDAIYFVYCRSGNRSAAASKVLVEMGYENIYDLGGINDWPYETVTGE